MIKSKKLEKGNVRVVYDISADGTFVNALGMNVLHNTDGFNFKLPPFETFRYTKEHPYIGKGLNREVKEGKEYVGFEADVAEFNDLYMRDFHYSPYSVNKMGLGIDEVLGGYNDDGTSKPGACIQFSRKNYADFFPDEPYPKDVKLVGNTIKSKKMPEYISKFLSVGIRKLLQGNGSEFLDEYYSYIEKIYNYKIPLRDIATKGKIKKSIAEYKKDVQEITKAGRPKSRQAWYELAIKYNLIVDNGDTVYYVNTGKSKSHSDVKKVTHYFYFNNEGEKVEFTKEIDKKYKLYKKECSDNSTEPLEKEKWLREEYPNHFTEEEILFNCVPVPTEIVESEHDTFCSEENGIEYNTAKYIDMFNKRITPLLVCFNRDIRGKILIENPEDRQFFTEEECVLSSGEPNKLSDQDTYEQLMTMEDKEIRFWIKYNLVPPFIEECKMGTWEEIKQDYLDRMEKEKQLGINIEREAFEKALNSITKEQIEKLNEEGIMPDSIKRIAELDPLTNNLVSKNFKDVVLGTINDIIEKEYDFDFVENVDDDVA